MINLDAFKKHSDKIKNDKSLYKKKVTIKRLLQCTPNEIFHNLSQLHNVHDDYYDDDVSAKNALFNKNIEKLEQIIYTDINASVDYACRFDKKLPKHIEERIFKVPGCLQYFDKFYLDTDLHRSYLLRWYTNEPHKLYIHAVYVMQKRWHAAESYIVNDFERAIQYAEVFHIKIWPELDNAIIMYMNDMDSIDFDSFLTVMYSDRRWEIGEPHILSIGGRVLHIYVEHLQRNNII